MKTITASQAVRARTSGVRAAPASAPAAGLAPRGRLGEGGPSRGRLCARRSPARAGERRAAESGGPEDT